MQTADLTGNGEETAGVKRTRTGSEETPAAAEKSDGADSQVNAANAAEVENFAEDCKRRFRREMMERMDHDWKDNR
eukprot:1839335-Rhodomonas_salina.3